MKCPNCQKENEPSSRFCIFCGTPLPSLLAGTPAEPAIAPDKPLNQQIRELQTEVLRLRERDELMNERLAALERMQGIEVPPLPVPQEPALALESTEEVALP